MVMGNTITTIYTIPKLLSMILAVFIVNLTGRGGGWRPFLKFHDAAAPPRVPRPSFFEGWDSTVVRCVGLAN